MWHRLLGGAAVAGLALLVLSYGGDLHPLGDSFAVFRLWISGGLAVGTMILILFGLRGWALITGVSSLIGAAPIAWAFYAPVPIHGAELVAYSKNTLGGRGDDAALVQDIIETGADVVFLQELSASRSDFVGALAEVHPYAHECHFSDWSGIGIYALWPLDETYCSPVRTIAGARMQTPDGPVWVVSVHLVWPYPFEQQELLEAAMPFLEKIDGPVIVAGDFNMVPWGASVRRVSRVTGSRVLGPLHTSLRVGGVPLQVDHVLTSGQGRVSLRPQFGADHHGVLAEIQLTTP